MLQKSSQEDISFYQIVKKSKENDRSIRNEFPKVTSFQEAINKVDLIGKVADKYDEDVIYYFHNREINCKAIKSLPDKFRELADNWVITGSAGLIDIRRNLIREVENLTRSPQSTSSIFLSLIGFMPQGLKIDKIYGDFIPTDIDIFVINSSMNQRNIADGVDIIHTVSTSVEELLLNFDLPCCRAAYNSTGFWVSAQCLVALFTGEYFLPEYTSRRSFLNCIEMGIL